MCNSKIYEWSLWVKSVANTISHHQMNYKMETQKQNSTFYWSTTCSWCTAVFYCKLSLNLINFCIYPWLKSNFNSSCSTCLFMNPIWKLLTLTSSNSLHFVYVPCHVSTHQAPSTQQTTHGSLIIFRLEPHDREVLLSRSTTWPKDCSVSISWWKFD